MAPEQHPSVLTQLTSRLVSPSAAQLVAAVTELVDEGTISPGTPMPTVRQLASALQVSPTTVHRAWTELRSEHVLRTDGRRGTFATTVPSAAAEQFRSGLPELAQWRRGSSDTSITLDLSTGAPDERLLPEIDVAALIGSRVRHWASYDGPVIVEPLESAVRALWGAAFTPQRITVVDGSLDAMDRLISATVRPGHRVALENPTYPPIRHLLSLAGARIVPIGVDDRGPIPAELRNALRRDISTLIIQPRAQNPVGCSLDEARLDELAAVLAGTDTTIIEHDSAGDIASAPLLSLHSRYPERVVRVHGFSKSHGPDLRLAVIGGPAPILDAVTARRDLGPAWTSRLLQRVLAALLVDPEARHVVDHARSVYHERAQAFRRRLLLRGVHTLGDDGYNIWIPTPHAMDTVVGAAARGISIAPG